MIKLKESQLIAMLNIVKENPDVDIWELMSASGIRVLEEKLIDLNFHPTNRTFTKKVPPKGQRYHPGQEEFYK